MYTVHTNISINLTGLVTAPESDDYLACLCQSAFVTLFGISAPFARANGERALSASVFWALFLFPPPTTAKLFAKRCNDYIY